MNERHALRRMLVYQRTPEIKETRRTFWASLLYSATNSSRSRISSVSDIPPKSPLVEVHVALLRTPLELLLTGSAKREKEAEEVDGLGWRSGVTICRESLVILITSRAMQLQRLFFVGLDPMHINQKAHSVPQDSNKVNIQVCCRSQHTYLIVPHPKSCSNKGGKKV